MTMLNYTACLTDFDRQLLSLSTSRAGGVSQEAYASMNLCHYVGDLPENVQTNRLLFCKKLGIESERLFLPHQTHEDRILKIDEAFLHVSQETQLQLLEGIDGLITDRKRVCIGVSTADCVPVFLYDPVKQAIAIIHAGWRGTVARIVSKAVFLLKEQYGSDAVDLHAAIGPCISQAHYEVGEELYTVFTTHLFPVDHCFARHPVTARWHLDLREANRWLLMESGIPGQQIEISGICTYAQSSTYFSARKSGVYSGRIASCMMLK